MNKFNRRSFIKKSGLSAASIYTASYLSCSEEHEKSSSDRTGSVFQVVSEWGLASGNEYTRNQYYRSGNGFPNFRCPGA